MTLGPRECDSQFRRRPAQCSTSCRAVCFSVWLGLRRLQRREWGSARAGQGQFSHKHKHKQGSSHPKFMLRRVRAASLLHILTSESQAQIHTAFGLEKWTKLNKVSIKEKWREMAVKEILHQNISFAPNLMFWVEMEKRSKSPQKLTWAVQTLYWWEKYTSSHLSISYLPTYLLTSLWRTPLEKSCESENDEGTWPDQSVFSKSAFSVKAYFL